MQIPESWYKHANICACKMYYLDIIPSDQRSKADFLSSILMATAGKKFWRKTYKICQICQRRVVKKTAYGGQVGVKNRENDVMDVPNWI